MRLFAAVHVDSRFYELVSATGVVDALEQVGHAPEGAMLLTDTDDGGQGRLVAEATDRGWVLVSGHQDVSGDRGRRG